MDTNEALDVVKATIKTKGIVKKVSTLLKRPIQSPNKHRRSTDSNFSYVPVIGAATMAATVASEIAEKRMVELSCDGEWILIDRIISSPVFFHVVVVPCNLPCTARKCVCGDDLMSTLT